MEKSSALVKSIILGKKEGKRRGGQPAEGKWTQSQWQQDQNWVN